MIRVGRIPYLNVAPFHHYWSAGDVAFIEKHPRQLGLLAREGLLDCAPLPVVDGFALEETFEPCGSFGIAAEGKVMSVLLFSRVPLERLEGRTLAVTGASSTSRALLGVLLRRRYGLREFTLVTEGEGEIVPSALLLIGDQALAALHAPRTWEHCSDLATLWHEWTGLPFTFARWIVRKALPGEARRALARALDESLARAERSLGAIAQYEEGRTGLPRDVILPYLENFTFRLGPREEEGMRLFREELSRCEVRA